jgi:hypothetical protein
MLFLGILGDTRMLFDRAHCLFMAVSAAVIALLLIGAKRFLKTDRAKDLFLKLTALAVVLVHLSPLYADFLSTGEAKVASNMLFPVYPCNLAMWFLLLYAFLTDKNKLAVQFLGEFTFYLGLVGGIIGIAANVNYANTPDLRDWDIFAGLLSHSIMLLGCIWLLVGGYIRIRVRNTLSVFFGLLIMLLDGFLIIHIFRRSGLEPPNSMFLLGVPFERIRWLNTATIGVLSVVVTFVFTLVYEMLALPADRRTFHKKQKPTKEGNPNV